MTEESLLVRNKELIDGLAGDVLSLGPERREAGLKAAEETLLEIVTEYVPERGFRERWVRMHVAAIKEVVERA